jgi:peptidase A4-like protein
MGSVMYRLPKLLTCTVAAGATALSLTMAFGPAASASPAPSTHTSAQALAYARAALRRLSVGQHAANHAVGAHQARLQGTTDVDSTNWSGYADTSETFSKATGSWKEPTVTCSGSTTELAAFWVGIDGYSSDSVEQDGTLAECYGGSLYQYSWWEMYPTNDIQVVGESVAAGDSITASVVRSGTSYTLKVTDKTNTANSFSTKQSCSGCANSSAEWIAEAPSGSSGVYPLAEFTPWKETGATVATTSGSGVISTYPNDNITMVDSSGSTEAKTGPLNSTGKAFTVTWVASS